MNRRELLLTGIGTGLAVSTSSSGFARTGISQIKIALIGESGVGKTCLALSFTTSLFPQGRPPSGFNTYTHNMLVDGDPTQLEITDTPGDEDYDRLRPLFYSGTHVAGIGFSLSRRSSFEAVTHRWLPEIRQHLPQAPIILMGLKADLRDTGSGPTAPQVDYEEGEALSQTIGAAAYFENSGFTQHNVMQSFQALIRAARGEALLPPTAPGRRQLRPGRAPVRPARRPNDRRGGN